MEDDFKRVMSERTDEQLIKIVTIEREKYQPLAIEAAESEIEKRNINITKFAEVEKKATIEKQEKEKVDSNTVSSLIRFVHFIIDTLVWGIFVSLVSVFLSFFIQSTDVGLIGYLILLGTLFMYYVFMEARFQKTVGKFITRTKVVKSNGDKPEASDILARTFFRLVPFDRLSFIFVRNGLHDYLSKTKVIKDDSNKKLNKPETIKL